MPAAEGGDHPSIRPTPAAAPLPPDASAWRRARRYTYELLLTPEVETEGERWVRGALTFLILANVLMVVLETVPSLGARFGRVFHVLEVISVAIFAVEYVLRVWSAVEDPRYAHPLLGRLRFMVTFFALVDLLAILPFFLPHLMKCDLRFVRGLRLMRLMRVFKLGRYSDSLHMYASILREKREELLVSMALLALLLLMASSVMYFLEHEAQPQHFSSIPASTWWGIITLTTIGYGDVFPVTPWGRVFGSFIAVLGVGFVALPSAILVSGMMDHMNLVKQQRRERLVARRAAAHAAHAATKAAAHAGANAAAHHPGATRCPHCGRYADEPPA